MCYGIERKLASTVIDTNVYIANSNDLYLNNWVVLVYACRCLLRGIMKAIVTAAQFTQLEKVS
jgi:hypothetical protein